MLQMVVLVCQKALVVLPGVSAEELGVSAEELGVLFEDQMVLSKN